MKKLLALILCVMMFVSVMSTAAFADKPAYGPHPDLDTLPLAPKQSAAANEKAIKNAKENIEFMYGVLAADNAVFGTVKTMDSIVGDLAKAMFADVDTAFGLTGDKLESNTKMVMRDYLGSEVVRYMNKHVGDFSSRSTSYTVGGAAISYTGRTTGNGSPIYVDAAGNIYGYNPTLKNWWQAPAGTTLTQAVLDNNGDRVGWTVMAAPAATTTWKYDPAKYATTFAAAVENAFNGKEGAAAIQALMYNLYAAKVWDDVNDELDDLFDEIVAWEDGTQILNQYHFHDTGINGFDNGIWDPYALLDNDFYPNTISIPAGILAP